MGQAIVIKAGGKDFDAELNDSVTAGAIYFGMVQGSGFTVHS
jgi:hypothetical protein